MLTREQMLEGHFTTVYDAVEALRPAWLRPRGPDSFAFPSTVWVYIDDVRAGGVDVLQNLQPGLVNTVRWYSGPEATGRWGVDHGAGVIHVSTWGEGALGFPRSDTQTRTNGWVATWEAAPQLTEERNLPPAPGLSGNTLRQIVHVSLGGERLRLTFSNAFGDGPLAIDDARIAASAGGGATRPGTDVGLAFAGKRSVTLAAGAAVVSDPIKFPVSALSDVAVTIHFGAVPHGITGHPGSRTTSYLQTGDWVADTTPPSAVRVEHWYVLSGIEVIPEHSDAAAVVVLGNSIADGRGSGTDRQDRWPDNLARRLQADPRTNRVAVLNAGIGGNCVLRFCLGPSGLDRLHRDVLDQAGVHWLVVSEGVNDIGGTRSPDASGAVADSLIVAYKRIIDAAHARGLRAYGATILPFGGSFYDSPAHEKARQTVNAWIRDSGAFDAVIDLDLAMRDPAQPSRLRGEVDSGDHLHPNEVGYHRMADAIDLTLFARK